MTELLEVLLDGRHVATLTEVGQNMGLGASLQYTPEVVERCGEGALLLSTSLPVQMEIYPAVVTRYFLEGLLPEAEVRATLAARARLAASDTFGLLRVYGLDCAGAVQVVEPGRGPRALGEGVRWLDEDELDRAIRDLPAAPLGVGVDDGVRSSLGGVQGKLPVVVDGDRLGVPLNGAASTHILKPARLAEGGNEAWPGIVAAEAFGLRLVAEVGRLGGLVRAAECRPMAVSARRALLVTRFDRRRSEVGVVSRVHQEDLAQALGTLDRYQLHDSMPPRWVDVAALLQRAATVPAMARRTLLEMVVLNTMLGNCDFHAKNLSVVLDEGQVVLAPAYDVVPTAVWPHHSRELALRIGGEVYVDDVVGESLLAEAGSWGMRRTAAARIVENVIGWARAAVPTVKEQAAAEGWDDPILEAVVAQTYDRLRQLTS